MTDAARTLQSKIRDELAARFRQDVIEVIVDLAKEVIGSGGMRELAEAVDKLGIPRLPKSSTLVFRGVAKEDINLGDAVEMTPDGSTTKARP